MKRVKVQITEDRKKFRVPALLVRWVSCPKKNCAVAKQKLDKAGLNPKQLQFLSPQSKVVEVRHGDINRDGLTDVMVRLSSGAAYVYQQRGR